MSTSATSTASTASTVPEPLGPVAQLRAGRLGRRLPQLLVGFVLYGLSMAMMIRSSLGNMPWDVLHQGIVRHLPIDFGTVVIATSVLVLLLWIPLRELPGLGTVANSLLVGLFADAGLALLPAPAAWWARALLVVGAIALNAVATALYLGARLGPGPRDGLMTGLHRRTGISVRVVRTTIEVVVVLVGWLLGGVLGVGTVLYALAIGPLVQLLLPRLTVDLSHPDRARPAGSAASSGRRRPRRAPRAARPSRR